MVMVTEEVTAVGTATAGTTTVGTSVAPTGGTTIEVG